MTASLGSWSATQGWRPSRGDIALALALTTLSVLALPYLDGMSTTDADVGVPAYLLVAVAGLVLQVRDRWPVPVLVLCGAATAIYLALGHPYGPVLFSFAVAVYTVGRRTSLTTALAWSTAAGAALLVHLFTHPSALDFPLGVLPALSWVVVPVTVGIARRLVSEARARERAESDRRLVTAERLRISHEVHDVVGHGLAAIQMQADIALHLGRDRPDRAFEALSAISAASSEALAELRETLAAVRPDADAERGPAPGLARLDGLVERVRAAGVQVDVGVVGDPRPVSAAVDLAAYRLLQEALTNVVKHASRPRVTVCLEYRHDVLVLTTANPCSHDAHVEGFGMKGMRRRAGQLGGRLEARERTDPESGERSFVVRATLPLRK